ncbi:MAG: penicillin-binding protein [Bacteroidales bacterium]|jgi:cell division protein FtsI (penicillin-binding protein 3)|nr:penicillin-binding protein [Bacteroidales bacterium]
MPLKKDIVWRVGVVYVFVLVLAGIIIGRVLYLQIIEGGELRKISESINFEDIIVKSNRGEILAADGRMLASSIPYYDIRMDTRSTGMKKNVFAKNIDSLAYSLSVFFKDKSAKEYKKQITIARQNNERFYLVKRRVNYNQLKEIKTFPLFRLGQYKGGLIVITNNIRIQPHVNLASRTIGSTTKSEAGNTVGIEGAYDHELKGVDGVRLMQKLHGNVWIPVNDGNEVEPRDGNDVVTTLDVNIQDVAESALMRQLKKQEAHHGTVVLMEVATGEVKAIANLERNSKGEYKETYNYAVGESTEPGSTFKLASMIAILEDGYVDVDDSVNTGDGTVYYYDTKMSDSKIGGYGKISVKDAFVVSSNVGVSKIITKYYTGKEHKFIDRLYRMNLNKKLNLDIMGEGVPRIKYPGDKLWSGISLPMMSIGYEVSMTPLQILAFYNAIANNGRMVKPMFVKSLMYHGDKIKSFETKTINQSICSRSTLKKVKEMLEGVVENGTARNLKNNNYKIAGKTGTCQIANKKYGYKDNSKVSYQASFVGYFPADNPKYSCIVVVNSPSKNIYYGNLVAGPVFKEISDKVYATRIDMHKSVKKIYNNSQLKVAYSKHGNKNQLVYVLKSFGMPVEDDIVDSDWVVTTKKDSCIKLANRYIDNGIMPKVVGMGVKDALYILENLGLEVRINGRGSIQEQSIQYGKRIKKGDEVVLTMSFIK